MISISLPPVIARILDKIRRELGQSRSSFIARLIKDYQAEKDWEEIYKLGRQTAKKFGIKSEADVLRILND